MNKMSMDILKMSDAIAKLDSAILNLENIYKELNDRMQTIGDSSESWNGDSQNAAYKCYINIANGYPKAIDQMVSLRDFLEDALNSYIVSDSVLNKSVDNNEAGLDVQ